MKRLTLFLIGFLLLFTQPNLHAEVTLPRVIGSNMVLQRDMQVPIWGWASAGEEVTIILNTENVGTEPLFSTAVVADAEGNWRTKLPAMAAGGPYILKVSSSNTLELTNILFGEVWICSGQSNMQCSVSASKDSEVEIAAADYPNIRLFYVPRVPSGLAAKRCGSGLVRDPIQRQSLISRLLPTISDGNFIRTLMYPSD